MSELKQKFELASKEALQLSKRPDNETMLSLYACFKQATQGDVSGKRPGFTDLTGRAKWDAWSKLKGMSQEKAMQAYIDLMDGLKRRAD
jgi:acyl-CoA-binding protein